MRHSTATKQKYKYIDIHTVNTQVIIWAKEYIVVALQMELINLCLWYIVSQNGYNCSFAMCSHQGVESISTLFQSRIPSWFAWPGEYGASDSVQRGALSIKRSCNFCFRSFRIRLSSKETHTKQLKRRDERRKEARHLEENLDALSTFSTKVQDM